MLAEYPLMFAQKIYIYIIKLNFYCQENYSLMIWTKINIIFYPALELYVQYLVEYI